MRALVVGAGVFGAWIASTLHARGWRVTLVDQHGPASARASSGGETRIIRSGYGNEAVYARWAREAMPDWLDLERRAGQRLFVRTGALFVGRNRQWLADTEAVLVREGIACEAIDSRQLAKRFPQLAFDEGAAAVFEPGAGVLYARRAVQSLVQTLVDGGVELRTERVELGAALRDGADSIVLAAGPWLPRLLPDLLDDVIRPTRQEVFFFGAPAGDVRFSAPHLPAWVSFDEGVYGLPDLEHRGVKVAVDAHGETIDPETMDRSVTADAIDRMRRVLRRRMPALADAPLVEARVCQYENTTNGHLLLDRLPGHDRVWIAGGGSGHGFKHGPSVGRYVADLIEEQRQPDPLFTLSGRPSRARVVF